METARDVNNYLREQTRRILPEGCELMRVPAACFQRVNEARMPTPAECIPSSASWIPLSGFDLPFARSCFCMVRDKSESDFGKAASFAWSAIMT